MREKTNELQDLKSAHLSPEASFDWDSKHGYAHLCVRCNKNQYQYGNMGLCYNCVQAENESQKLEKELRSEPIEITLGKGELSFLIGELDFVKRSHDGALYYISRINMVLDTLRKWRNKK